MKKSNKTAYVLAICLIFLLSACTDYNNPPSTQAETDIKGHHYLVLRSNGNFGQTYVHDPECLMRDLGR